MGVNSLNRGTILTGVKYNNFLAGNEAFDYNSDILISSQVLSANATSVTFSSIPQGYKHLQLRWTAKNTSTSTTMTLRVNDISTSSYTNHYMTANGSTIGAANFTGSGGVILPFAMPSSTTTSAFGQGIADILDYTSTAKHKPVRYVAGVGMNTSQRGVGVGGGVLVDTPAITSLTLLTGANNFAVGSRFSLYGSLG